MQPIDDLTITPIPTIFGGAQGGMTGVTFDVREAMPSDQVVMEHHIEESPVFKEPESSMPTALIMQTSPGTERA